MTRQAKSCFRNTRKLWRIEDTFGEFKGTLKARPIFHWKDRRIAGHLTMCFLALLCEAHVTRAVRRAKDDYDGRAVRDEIIEARQLSAVTVFRELADVRAIPVSVGSQKFWVRTDIKGHVAVLFQRLGLRIPPRLRRILGRRSRKLSLFCIAIRIAGPNLGTSDDA